MFAATARQGFSGCKSIASPILAMTMRVERVVQLGTYGFPLQPHPCLLLGCHALFYRVLFLVQAGTAMKDRFCPRGTDVFQDRLVADQRLAGPVGADRPKQLVLDRVP